MRRGWNFRARKRGLIRIAQWRRGIGNADGMRRVKHKPPAGRGESPMVDVLEELRAAERHLRIAAAKARDYRGRVSSELTMRDAYRLIVKTIMRTGALADRIEKKVKP